MAITCTPIKLNFMITGHGRSGTKYMYKLFNWLGFLVGDKWNGHDGMSHDFPMSVQSNLWPMREFKRYYHHLIQVVRNPHKVVESTYLCRVYNLVEDRAERIPEIARGNKIERTIRSLVLWNQAIKNEKPDLVVKVEEAPRVCRAWLIENGFAVKDNPKPPPPTDVNSRDVAGWDSGRVPWDKIGPEVRRMYKKHCEEYEYYETISDVSPRHMEWP